MSATTTQQAKPATDKEFRQTPEQHTRKAPCPPQPILRFTPTAWAKLLFFRDRGTTEIGGFAITQPDDLLCVVDFVTVKQEVSVASVSFDDEAVADFFETQVDAGRRPEQFARIWLHTHPGNSPEPSFTDEETFHRVFGKCEWALMFVLARNGKTSARLRFNVGPKGQILVPVQVTYTDPFPATDHEAWEAEYQTNIKGRKEDSIFGGEAVADLAGEFYDYSYPQTLIEELETMEPDERKLVLDELAGRPDLW